MTRMLRHLSSVSQRSHLSRDSAALADSPVVLVLVDLALLVLPVLVLPEDKTYLK